MTSIGILFGWKMEAAIVSHGRFEDAIRTFVYVDTHLAGRAVLVGVLDRVRACFSDGED